MVGQYDMKQDNSMELVGTLCLWEALFPVCCSFAFSSQNGSPWTSLEKLQHRYKGVMSAVPGVIPYRIDCVLLPLVFPDSRVTCPLPCCDLLPWPPNPVYIVVGQEEEIHTDHSWLPI